MAPGVSQTDSDRRDSSDKHGAGKLRGPKHACNNEHAAKVHETSRYPYACDRGKRHIALPEVSEIEVTLCLFPNIFVLEAPRLITLIHHLPKRPCHPSVPARRGIIS